jgi:hypothetical protein
VEAEGVDADAGRVCVNGEEGAGRRDRGIQYGHYFGRSWRRREQRGTLVIIVSEF